MIKTINLKHRFALLITTFLIAPLSFADDPFGFDINVSPTKYDYCSLNDTNNVELKGKYTCTNAPKPHRDFEKYILTHTDGIGLCMLNAQSKPMYGDSYGDQTWAKMEAIKAQLKERYGEPTKAEVGDNDREYKYLWFDVQVGNVALVNLSARYANRAEATVIFLSYVYNNRVECFKNPF